MNKKLIPIYASAVILALFTLRYILTKNFEFLTYTVTLGILIYLIALSDKTFNYSSLAKWGFAVWLFSHLAGGTFKIAGTRLYDWIIFDWIGEPFNILRYDQVIHAFCYVVITLFVYSIVVYIAKKSDKKLDNFLIGLITFLAGMGIGGINEIIEFSTVAFFSATGVGNYYNNALDLVFNAIGALIAVLAVHKRA
jgi:putative membrane protein